MPGPLQNRRNNPILRPSFYPTAVLADGPVGYWRLGEASGDAADSSGNGLTGTAGTINANTIIYRVAGAIAHDPNTAVNLNNGGYFDMGNPALLQITGALTLEAWVQGTGAGNWSGDIQSKRATGSVAWQLSFGLAAFNQLSAKIVGKQLNSSRNLNDRYWHHVAMVYIPSTSLSIYIDGMLDVQSTSSIPASITNFAVSARIGGTSDGLSSFSQGAVDEVALYSKAIDVTRLLAHYRIGRGAAHGLP